MFSVLAVVKKKQTMLRVPAMLRVPTDVCWYTWQMLTFEGIMAIGHVCKHLHRLCGSHQKMVSGRIGLLNTESVGKCGPGHTLSLCEASRIRRRPYGAFFTLTGDHVLFFSDDFNCEQWSNFKRWTEKRISSCVYQTTKWADIGLHERIKAKGLEVTLLDMSKYEVDWWAHCFFFINLDPEFFAEWSYNVNVLVYDWQQVGVFQVTGFPNNLDSWVTMAARFSAHYDFTMVWAVPYDWTLQPMVTSLMVHGLIFRHDRPTHWVILCHTQNVDTLRRLTARHSCSSWSFEFHEFQVPRIPECSWRHVVTFLDLTSFSSISRVDKAFQGSYPLEAQQKRMVFVFVCSDRCLDLKYNHRVHLLANIGQTWSNSNTIIFEESCSSSVLDWVETHAQDVSLQIPWNGPHFAQFFRSIFHLCTIVSLKGISRTAAQVVPHEFPRCNALRDVSPDVANCIDFEALSNLKSLHLVGANASTIHAVMGTVKNVVVTALEGGKTAQFAKKVFDSGGAGLDQVEFHFQVSGESPFVPSWHTDCGIGRETKVLVRSSEKGAESLCQWLRLLKFRFFVSSIHERFVVSSIQERGCVSEAFVLFRFQQSHDRCDFGGV